jgi:hypothetical protein
LQQSKSQKIHKHLIDATHAILFFGTPHRGLRTTELEAMLEDMSSSSESNRADLLCQLQEGSEFLETQADEVVDILGRRKVVSFYETVKTPTVQKVNRPQIYKLCDRADRLLALVFYIKRIRKKWGTCGNG